MRLFVAVALPTNFVEESARVLEILKQQPIQANFVPKGNLHITLVFLGELDGIDAVKNALSKVRVLAFNAALTHAGVFTPKFVKVVWLGIQGSGFAELHTQICTQLVHKPQFGYKPHITLARVKSLDDKEAFLHKLKSIKVEPISFKVESFKLMSSALTPQGPVYEELADFPLIT